MKTLKYDEVHRQEYRDLAEARASIQHFLEKGVQPETASLGARLPRAGGLRKWPRAGCRSAGMKVSVRFIRHGGIYRSDVSSHLADRGRSTAFRTGPARAKRTRRKFPRPTHRRDEFRPAIPQRGARHQSPSPLHRHAHPKSVPGSGTMNLQRTVNSVLTVCLTLGDNPSVPTASRFGSQPNAERGNPGDSDAL